MEEAPENGKESPHSAHANGLINGLHIIKYSPGPLSEILGPSEKNLLVPLARVHKQNIYTNWKYCHLLERLGLGLKGLIHTIDK
jgi:hypothetical protein